MDNNIGINSKKIINATKWSVITEVATKLISPFVNIVLARLLVPEAFGAVATISMVISFADMLTDSGFQKYIVQHEFDTEEEYTNSVNVAFWSNFLLSIVIVSVIISFRHQIADAVGAPDLSLGIAMSSVAILFTSFSGVHMATYRRALDFRTLFYLRIITSVLPFIVTIPLALFLRNYWALVIGTLANDLIQAIILSIRPKVKIRLFYSIALLRRMISFTGFTLLETLSIWLTTNIDIFLVGRLFDSYHLGLYKISMQTVNSCMNVLSGAISTVLFASLSRYQNDKREFNNVFNRFQSYFAIICIPMGVGIFIFRDLVTYILLGPKWSDASDFIGLWGFASSFSVIICYFASEVFRSKGKPLFSFFYQMMHVITLVPLVLLTSSIGFEALCTARCAAIIELVFSALILLHVCFDIKIDKVLKNIYIQIFASIVMGMVGNYLRLLNDGILWQALCVLICVLVYFLLLLFTPIRKELLKLKTTLKQK